MKALFSQFISICLIFLFIAGKTLQSDSHEIWKEAFYSSEEVSSRLESLPHLLPVRYALETNDWLPGKNCFDLRRKILILVHVTGNYSSSSLAHITAVRLDNEINDREHRDLELNSYHDLRCSQDKDWIFTSGWKNTLNITFFPTQQKLVLPPARNGDCLTGYIHLPGLKPLVKQNHSIPRNLFVVSRDSVNHRISIVEKLTSLVRIMNPGWNIVNVPLDHIQQTVKEITSGDNRILSALNTLQPIAYKLDLYRLIQLFHQGGVWMDSKLVPLRPLDFLLPSYPKTAMMIWDVKHSGIYNAFLAFQKGDPFLKVAINAILRNVEGRFYGEDWLDPTGPKCLLHAWKYYVNVSHQLNSQRDTSLRVDLSTILSKQGIMITRADDEQLEPLILSHNIEMRRKGFGHQRKCHYGNLWKQKSIYSEQPCQESADGQ